MSFHIDQEFITCVINMIKHATPNFPSIKVEKGFPDSILYKHDLYRAYIEICNPEDQQHLKMVRSCLSLG